ncbi:MAG: hypothetical protein WCX97_05110 [Candidatus Magasanikbacteria bacterium]
MSVIQKILISVSSVAVLGVVGYFIFGYPPDSKQNSSSNPENIVSDYQNLLTEAEQLQIFVGANCDNKNDINKKIQTMEKQLANLADRKKDWLDNVPKLPDVEPEIINSENPLGRPGSEVPELSSDVPPLPDVGLENTGAHGSQVPELSSDVPPLPDIGIDSIDSEYIPEMPELNTGRPGSEVPELSSDVPPLPDIDEANVIDPNEYIFQIEESEKKIKDILQALKALCQAEEKEPAKKVISDKCSDACQRYKDCAAYTEDATSADLNDAYSTCMEECPTWSKEMIKCINTIDIRAANDCVSFVQCQLPQFYEEKLP